MNSYTRDFGLLQNLLNSAKMEEVWGVEELLWKMIIVLLLLLTKPNN